MPEQSRGHRSHAVLYYTIAGVSLTHKHMFNATGCRQQTRKAGQNVSLSVRFNITVEQHTHGIVVVKLIATNMLKPYECSKHVNNTCVRPMTFTMPGVSLAFVHT